MSKLLSHGFFLLCGWPKVLHGQLWMVFAITSVCKVWFNGIIQFCICVPCKMLQIQRRNYFEDKFWWFLPILSETVHSYTYLYPACAPNLPPPQKKGKLVFNNFRLHIWPGWFTPPPPHPRKRRWNTSHGQFQLQIWLEGFICPNWKLLMDNLAFRYKLVHCCNDYLYLFLSLIVVRPSWTPALVCLVLVFVTPRTDIFSVIFQISFQFLSSKILSIHKVFSGVTNVLLLPF